MIRVATEQYDDDRFDILIKLIDEEGNELGIRPLRQVREICLELGYFLLLVDGKSNPPAYMLIKDSIRYKFEQEKSAREAKKKHHIVDVKEIKMRYKIEEHDYQTKLRHAKEFLTEGDKVKVLIMLRGREVQHKDLALGLMARFWKELEELEDLAIMDREAKLEGKSVIMILAPNPQRTRS